MVYAKVDTILQFWRGQERFARYKSLHHISIHLSLNMYLIFFRWYCAKDAGSYTHLCIFYQEPPRRLKGRLKRLYLNQIILTENQKFFLRDHMMDTSKWASSIGPEPGKGSTCLRGCSTSAPELSSSVALGPPRKALGPQRS